MGLKKDADADQVRNTHATRSGGLVIAKLARQTETDSRVSFISK